MAEHAICLPKVNKEKVYRQISEQHCAIGKPSKPHGQFTDLSTALYNSPVSFINYIFDKHQKRERR
jgi:hypothetical protein